MNSSSKLTRFCPENGLLSAKLRTGECERATTKSQHCCVAVLPCPCTQVIVSALPERVTLTSLHDSASISPTLDCRGASCLLHRARSRRASASPYLVVHKGQILCKHYCKLGHQTPYSRHQQRQRWCRDNGAWSQPMPGRRCREQWQRQVQVLPC